MITIFRQINGIETVVCEVGNQNASYNNSLMSRDEVVVSIIVEEPLPILVGDYVRYGGVTYTLNREPEFTKKSNTEYQYGIVFEHPAYIALDKVYTYRITDETRFWLTGTLEDFLGLWLENIGELDSGWIIGNCPATQRKNIRFESILCRDVLNKLAAEFSVEYNFENKRLDFYERLENHTSLVFEQGKGKGLYVLSQRNVDTDNTVTRAILYGGTKNIPIGYRDGSEHIRWSDPVTGKKYVENFSEYSKVVERDVYFEDVYPHFDGVVDAVRGENNGIIRCDAIDFDLNEHLIGGVPAKINFLTGDLTGLAFELTYDHAAKEVTLIPQEDETAFADEDGNRPLIPSPTRKPQPDDLFNFTDIDMPDEYVQRAEEELHSKGIEWLNYHSQLRVAFDLTVDHRYLRKNGYDLHVGDIVRIRVPEKNLDRTLRIISVERNLKTGALTCEVSNYLLATWQKEIEGRIEAARQQAEIMLSEVLYGINASKEWTGRNFARLRGGNDLTGDQRIDGDLSIKEALFQYIGDKVVWLRDKLLNNNIIVKLFRLHAKQVLVDEHLGSEDFIPGLTGYRISSSGDAELESLILRRFLEVPELRFNRIDVIVGDRWRSPGGGLIQSVDFDERIVTLHLEDGEISNVKPGDICMGTFHSLDAADNSADDYDDSKGNRRFSGFYTAYFTVTEVLDGGRFRYDLRPVSDAYPKQFHPAEAMNFVAYGSFTDPERRTSVYETRTYRRYLAGVDDWEFRVENIEAQDGNLDNLSIYGVDMTGYSSYVDRIYMRGTIDQIDADGNPIPDQFSEWSSAVAKWRKGAIVELGGYLLRAKRETSVPPVPLLTSGDGYLTSGDGYLLAGPVEQFINSDDWEIFQAPARDGEPGREGTSVQAQYSADGASWHDAFANGDIYMRTRQGSGAWSSAIRMQGPVGVQGMLIRTTEWAIGFEYRNDTDLTTTPRYLDVVTVGSGTGQKRYQCRQTHTSSAGITTDNTQYWQEMNDMAPIYTPLLIAPNAEIRFAQSQRMVVMDEAGNVVGGMTGLKASDGNLWPIWAGGANPATAPFRVGSDGSFVATKAIVEGVIRATSGIIAETWEIDRGRIGSIASTYGMSILDSFMKYSGDGFWAGFGQNVMSVIGGFIYLARLENSQSNSYGENGGLYVKTSGGTQKNVGISVSASGAPVNEAIQIVDGWISGAAYCTKRITASYTVKQEDVFLSCGNSSAITITLPSPASMQIGKVVYVRNVGGGGINVTTPSGNFIHTNTAVSSTTGISQRGWEGKFTNDGNYWLFQLTGVS